MGVIDIKNITKYYGKVCALDDVSLTIEENKIYGLLGRNGAGKTTLLNLITNKIFPTKGRITIDGESVIENGNALSMVFYMAEMDLYPEGMKVKEMFKWTKEFYPSFDMDYANKLCEKFELNANKKIKSLSTGYNTISKLILALSSNAPILLLDEPISGMDANNRDLFYKELLSGYAKKPKTIILSTHMIEEIADILERIIIIKDKCIIADDTVENLLKRAYCVSGSAESVDKFIACKTPINIEQMASYKSAVIMGEISNGDRNMARELNLEFSRVKLQKLFIYLTNTGGEI